MLPDCTLQTSSHGVQKLRALGPELACQQRAVERVLFDIIVRLPCEKTRHSTVF